MNILRFLHHDCIHLDMAFRPTPAEVDELPAHRERRLAADKEAILAELAEVMDRSGAIVNRVKFLKDLINRERKATTALGPGIAIPHVRSLQVRTFIMGVARAPGDGYDFASLDGRPTRLFLMLASPSHRDSDYDRIYLAVYRQFAEMIQLGWVVESLLDANTPQDVLNILRGYVHQ
jgi:PTS system fructose-specific IIC component